MESIEEKRGMIFMKTISLKVSEAMDARLRAIAKKKGTNKAAIVRAALESFLVSINGDSKPSILDLARDLVGSVEGPCDLSTNKKHMEGYGT
jgi:hypothetical protein